SERSGIASIGVDVSAHHPQPARPRYRTMTMNRFFSATSMSRLIMLASPKLRGAQGAKAGATTLVMSRAYARETTSPDAESEQIHDGREWLNEEDREEDVLRHWSDGYRRRRTP